MQLYYHTYCLENLSNFIRSQEKCIEYFIICDNYFELILNFKLYFKHNLYDNYFEIKILSCLTISIKFKLYFKHILKDNYLI